MEELRLQKFLANAGVCSRRKAEEYILDGKVKVKVIIADEMEEELERNTILYENDRDAGRLRY